VFDPSSSAFVVTWAKCGVPLEERIAVHKDPLVWIPSVAAVATLYDRGCIPPSQVVYAAMAIGAAWAAGDRDMLDTEEAKKAAELLHDLSSMCVNASSPSVAKDVSQAMRHLLDEMAAVAFAGTDAKEFEDGAVLPSLDKSTSECFADHRFTEWPAPSMRRRFLFSLNKRERTPVAYTLISLLFDVGSCPLLSLSDRRGLRMQSIKASGLSQSFSPAEVHSFFAFALSQMRNAKAEGKTRLGARMTSQQLADSLLCIGDGM